ncbi:MAG: hypothetical protein AAGE94_21415 [Acidobacteriota bacterium]
MSECKTSKRTVHAALRRAKALELRKAGATYDQIADQLGYASRASAYKAVAKALKAIEDQVVEGATEMCRLEVERLDRLLVALWPKASAGHLGAIDRVIRISERRCRLLGIDAAIRADHQVTATVQVEAPPSTPDEAQAYLDQMLGVGTHGS